MVCLSAVPARARVVTEERLGRGAVKGNQIHLHLRNILKQITYFGGRGSERRVELNGWASEDGEGESEQLA